MQGFNKVNPRFLELALFGECHTQIIVGLDRIRLEPNGCLILLDGFIRSIRSHEQSPKINVRIDIVWITTQYIRQSRQGFFHVTCISQRKRKIVASVDSIRFQTKRLAVLRNSFIDLAGLD